MTDFIDDAVSILKFSFSWLKQKSLWKYFMGGVIAYALLGLAQPATGMRLLYVGLAMLVGIALFVIIEYFVMRAGMKLKGYKLIDNSVTNFVRFLIAGIYIAIVSVFSLFDLKFLAVAIVSGILLTFSFVAMTAPIVEGGAGPSVLTYAALGLSVILALVYVLIMVRNFLRLFPASGHFLTGKGVRESARLSWNQTPGMAAKIFVINLLVTIPIALISYAGSIIDVIFKLAGNSALSTAGLIVSAVFSGFALILTSLSYAGFYEWVFKQRPIKTAALNVKPKAKPVARKK